jgi:excisionase family DNA binding protein
MAHLLAEPAYSETLLPCKRNHHITYTTFMENPFELILERLNVIEALLRKATQEPNNATVVLNSALPDVLNLQQASELISLTKSAIYKKTAERTIPHFKQGKKLYFKKSELYEWLTNQRISTKAEIEKEATEYIGKKGRLK